MARPPAESFTARSLRWFRLRGGGAFARRRRLGLRRNPLNSLTARVIALTSLWVVVALVVAGGLISTLYERTAMRGFEDLLTAQLYNLVNSVTASSDGRLSGNPDLGDLRYAQPLSGWYWEVVPASANTHGRLTSGSLGFLDIPTQPAQLVPVRPLLSPLLRCRWARRRAAACDRNGGRARSRQPCGAVPGDGQPVVGVCGRRPVRPSARLLSRGCRRRDPSSSTSWRSCSACGRWRRSAGRSPTSATGGRSGWKGDSRRKLRRSPGR